MTGPDWGADYWCTNVRRPVRFSDTIETLIDEGHRVFLEVGPHPVLSGNIRAILADKAASGLAIATLKRDESDQDRLLGVVGELYCAGCLGRTAPGQNTIAPHTELPRYPWQHKTLFAESRQLEVERIGDVDDRPLLGTRAARYPMAWSTELSVARLPWLNDHVVDGMVVLPGAAHLDAFLSAAGECTKGSSLTIESVRFSHPLIIDEHAVPTITVVVETATMRLSLSSSDDTDHRIVHSTARIVDAAVDAPRVEVPSVDGDALSQEEFYELLDKRGLHYGPAFRRVVEARIGADVIVTTIDPGSVDTSHLAHPAVVDAALQGVAAFDDLTLGTIVPVAVGTVRRHRPMPIAPITAVIRRASGTDTCADITICGLDGAVFLELVGVRFAELAPASSPIAELRPLLYEIGWQAVDPLTISSRADRPVLTVGLGAAGTDAAAPMQPMLLAAAIHQLEDAQRTPLGGAAVTVLVVAGDDEQISLMAGLLEVARQFDSAIDSAPELRIDAVLVTKGAFRLRDDHHEPNVLHATLVGARRVLQNEQLSVHWRHIDLLPGDDHRRLDPAMLTELGDGGQTLDEIALRAGVTFAPRYSRDLADRLDGYSETNPHVDPNASFVLEPPASRLITDLALRTVPRIAPEARQIEVRLDIVGLNYKDAMKILGVLTPENLRGTCSGTAIGMEGIGVVSRTGPLSRYGIGDIVLVSVPDMFRRYITLDPADGVAEPLTHDVAPGMAASLIPYLAAHYGLIHMARLAEDETVLVHGAAGGTGLAAVHVARHLGARVIGSAGTDERRSFARAAGAHHTVNSRTANFVDDVMRLTDGHGADVIYTSLPGEALRQNLKAAAEFGRIVDIGKADIYGNGAIELGPFDHNLQYCAVDVDRMFNHRRAFTNELSAEVIGRLDAGIYPPLPATTYDAGELTEAFSVVARGTQRGRVVVDLSGNPPVRPALPAFPVHADGTYLITGAFGAVGLALGDWLVAHGARHVIAVSRGGPRGGRAGRRLRAWRDAGADIHEEAVDVGDAAAVSRMIARVTDQMPPLRGVFHAAGVAEDNAYGRATTESVQRVLGPKLDGAWHLHHATETAGIDLDAFVLFSSTSAMIGIPLQIAYAAANAGLDALAQLRQARGQAGLSVNWGALRGGGMADSPEVRRYLDVLGQREIDVGHLPALLATVLAFSPKSSNVVVADIDWHTLLSGQPALKSSTRFADFAAGPGGGGLDFRAELYALPADQQLEVLTSTLVDQVAAVLGVPADAIDHHTSLSELGLDSLSSVELASRVAATLDIRISASDFERLPGVAAIAKQTLVAADVS